MLMPTYKGRHICYLQSRLLYWHWLFSSHLPVNLTFLFLLIVEEYV